MIANNYDLLKNSNYIQSDCTSNINKAYITQFKGEFKQNVKKFNNETKIKCDMLLCRENNQAVMFEDNIYCKQVQADSSNQVITSATINYTDNYQADLISLMSDRLKQMITTRESKEFLEQNLAYNNSKLLTHLSDNYTPLKTYCSAPLFLKSDSATIHTVDFDEFNVLQPSKQIFDISTVINNSQQMIQALSMNKQQTLAYIYYVYNNSSLNREQVAYKDKYNNYILIHNDYPSSNKFAYSDHNNLHCYTHSQDNKFDYLLLRIVRNQITDWWDARYYYLLYVYDRTECKCTEYKIQADYTNNPIIVANDNNPRAVNAELPVAMIHDKNSNRLYVLTLSEHNRNDDNQQLLLQYIDLNNLKNMMNITYLYTIYDQISYEKYMQTYCYYKSFGSTFEGFDDLNNSKFIYFLGFGKLFRDDNSMKLYTIPCDYSYFNQDSSTCSYHYYEVRDRDKTEAENQYLDNDFIRIYFTHAFTANMNYMYGFFENSSLNNYNQDDKYQLIATYVSSYVCYHFINNSNCYLAYFGNDFNNPFANNMLINSYVSLNIMNVKTNKIKQDAQALIYSKSLINQNINTYDIDFHTLLDIYELNYNDEAKSHNIICLHVYTEDSLLDLAPVIKNISTDSDYGIKRLESEKLNKYISNYFNNIILAPSQVYLRLNNYNNNTDSIILSLNDSCEVSPIKLNLDSNLQRLNIDILDSESNIISNTDLKKYFNKLYLTIYFVMS